MDDATRAKSGGDRAGQACPAAWPTACSPPVNVPVMDPNRSIGP